MSAHERIIWGTSDKGASASFARMCRIRLPVSKPVQHFLKPTLCLICRIPFVNRMALVHAFGKVSIELIEFIIIKSHYFQNAQKGECFLDDFEALVLQNGLRPHSSAQTLISRTTMRPWNVILKVASSKKVCFLFNIIIRHNNNALLYCLTLRVIKLYKTITKYFLRPIYLPHDISKTIEWIKLDSIEK
jgi:hypothetical protein